VSSCVCGVEETQVVTMFYYSACYLGLLSIVHPLCRVIHMLVSGVPHPAPAGDHTHIYTYVTYTHIIYKNHVHIRDHCPRHRGSAADRLYARWKVAITARRVNPVT